MNNADILELKKRYKKDNSITRIQGCYVLGMEKKIQTTIDSWFSDLDESEQFKYLELVKKGFSGVLGKNLQTLEFEKISGEDNNPKMMSLLALRNSELKDKNILDAFYQSIIEKYVSLTNYLILIIHDIYDVPAVGTDHIAQGESEETYSYIYCLICPVNLCKPGLSYHEDTNEIAKRERDWVVDMPEVGFLYPAFNERSTDVNALMYYCKDPKNNHPEIIEELLGCESVPSIDDEKEVFHQIVEDVINETKEYDTFEIVKSLNDGLTELAKNTVSSENLTIDKQGMRDLMQEAGLKEEHLAVFEERFDKEAGEDATFKVDSLREKKNMTMKSDDVKIMVKPESADLVEIRVIDGRKCIVIPMNSDMEINGIMKRIVEELKE
ncbi:MAG: DUF4317 domain-containing protein, partial [Lachnospiraceae bacterium]|nr:DUF4317 domain-containing protein [Lachnospiraceae bacterium]